MTIQERLKRSNLIMLVVPVAVAGVLLAVGLGVLLLLLENVYLPRLGLTMQDLHTLGEQAEVTFADLKRFIILYGVVVIAVLLAAVVGTNLWLTQNLFAHIRAPLAVLIAFSRMYLYVHFPSDILGGAVLGVGIGLLVLYAGQRFAKRKVQ